MFKFSFEKGDAKYKTISWSLFTGVVGANYTVDLWSLVIVLHGCTDFNIEIFVCLFVFWLCFWDYID